MGGERYKEPTLCESDTAGDNDYVPKWVKGSSGTYPALSAFPDFFMMPGLDKLIPQWKRFSKSESRSTTRLGWGSLHGKDTVSLTNTLCRTQRLP